MKVCVTVDMDNYAEYRRLVDPDGTTEGPSFYDAVPRFLELFARHGIRATFFLVGRDAEVPAHRRWIRELHDCGHEIANHSWSHPYNFRDVDRAGREREIARTEDVIADITGERPVGFRTPSAQLHADTLALLAERGYEYESCIFPTPVMWAFMLYGKLFVREPGYGLGEPAVAFAPTRPFRPSRERIYREARDGAGLPILEIPISVVPGIRIPFYNTLLRLLGTRAFDAFVAAFGERERMLHIQLHLIDLVDLGDSSLGRAMSDSIGLGVPFARRLRFAEHAMERLSRAGEGVPLREISREIRAELGLSIGDAA